MTEPRLRRGKFRCPDTLSQVSFAGMTPDKCNILRIGMLTGCPLCKESQPPLVQVKEPYGNWLLVGFHPVYSTPSDNT